MMDKAISHPLSAISRTSERRFRCRLVWMPALLISCLTFPAAAQGSSDLPSLSRLLEQAGKQVELFSRQFPAVTCTEKVSQVRLGEKGKILQRQESQSDYLIFLKLLDNDLLVEESRIWKDKPKKKKGAPLLVTNGFATLNLVFHPLYQNSFEFSQLSEETRGGDRLLRVHFQHVPGTRSTAALRLGAKDIPLELQGNAWFDPETLSIVRIVAELAIPLADRGLESLTSDVQYAPVRFANSDQAFWLPSSASIDIASRLQHWRNIHWFTEYRRFSVTVESVVKR
jgi:hypothetical protein